MRTAVYPGTFDPITNGHVDIIKRALNIFDKVIVAVSVDSAKNSLFTVEERIKMIREAVKDIQRVEVDSFRGLLVDYAKKMNAVAVIRGLRAVSDFEYEFQMALTNRHLNENIETVFLMPSEKYTYLNSSIVKELASLGGDITYFVPEIVKEELMKKIKY
ncbi:MAG: pantetheine-phosphate adenylyltransferase [Candidatus Helarchaeota archaeon]|nr:pantetheine-phosphate adenylyltransferase [Candidatus Helarchaeota archaeon]